MEPVGKPQGIPYPASDTDALPVVTANNLSCKADRQRFTELQQWLRGRAQ